MIVERVSSDITWVNALRDFRVGNYNIQVQHKAIDLSLPENTVPIFYCRVEHKRKGMAPSTKDAGVQKLRRLHFVHNNIKYRGKFRNISPVQLT